MGLFKRKEKKQKRQLFGNEIAPSCAYCLHNSSTAEKVVCPFAAKNKEAATCPRFAYDPLRREPNKREG